MQSVRSLPAMLSGGASIGATVQPLCSTCAASNVPVKRHRGEPGHSNVPVANLGFLLPKSQPRKFLRTRAVIQKPESCVRFSTQCRSTGRRVCRVNVHTPMCVRFSTLSVCEVLKK